MALCWDITGIKDYEALCYEGAGVDDEGDERVRLSPTTDGLIWATMAVDLVSKKQSKMNSITFRSCLCGMSSDDTES